MPDLVPRIVVLDVDGTLLDSSGRLPDRHRGAIEAARSAGALVVLATGKTSTSVTRIHRELELGTPMVCSQGTIVIDGDGNVAHRAVLPAQPLLRILEQGTDETLQPIAYVDAEIHADQRTPLLARLHDRYDEPEPTIGPIAELARAGRVNKLLLMGPGPVTADRRRRIEATVGSSADVTQSVPESIEILPRGVNKATGVRCALALLAADFAEVVAVGDAENDRELLAAAAIGIAMGNAPEELRGVADAVVATNDNGGVAEALERYWPCRS